MHHGEFPATFPGLCLWTAFAVMGIPAAWAEKPTEPGPRPIRAQLVTGGCSHDYATRQEILTRGIRERVARPIEWVVRMQGLGESDGRIPLFESAEWAKDFDIVVHDHCFPRVKDTAYVDRVLAPHRAGLPAVLLHGTMMSFRTGDERWFDFCGVTTRSHERSRSVTVVPVENPPSVPVGFPFWEIPREELYRIGAIKEGVIGLTVASDPEGLSHLTSWTHDYGPAKAKVFATTLGNETATVADSRYLDLVTRGFLWALSESLETSFRGVAEADSLKGFALPGPTDPLPRPGRNAAREGNVTAFTWGGETPATEDLARTNDGDPQTSWTSPTAAPGAWTITWGEPRMLGALLIYGSAPPGTSMLIEGTVDGRGWSSLVGEVPELSPERPVLLEWPRAEYLGLRITVPALPEAAGWTLREIAAYEDRSSVPAAVLVKLPPAPESSRRVPPAGKQGLLSRIGLAPGWRVVRAIDFPGGVEIGTLVPRASGDVLISLFPNSGGKGEVMLAALSGEDGFELRSYLTGIEPATSIAWDGEWLYTLSGDRLDRVRRALGQGPADERQRLGRLYELPDGEAPLEPRVHELWVGEDGWLRARISAERAGIVVSGEGRRVVWPSEGMLRFSLRGRGLTSERMAAGGAPSELPEGGWIEGEVVRRDDGSNVWLCGSDTGDRFKLLCLSSGGEASEASIDWHQIHGSSLEEIFSPSSRRPRWSDRIEAAMEWKRRKYPGGAPEPDWVKAVDWSPEFARLYVSAFAGTGDEFSRRQLETLSGMKAPSLQAAAFELIGDHPDVDPAIFAALGNVVEPQVSAAIFDGLRRSGAVLPGAEMVAMGLLDHDDSRLATAAMDLLIERKAIPLALQTLDEENERLWPGAFRLIAALPDMGAARSLIERLERHRDPAFRRVGLVTLASLYRVGFRDGDTWEGSAEIARYLSARISDPRVDRSALLEAMQTHALPAPTPQQLFQLGRDDLRFLAFTIENLLAATADPLPEGSIPWLTRVATDESQDPEIRLKAQALIAGAGGSGDYRQWYARTLQGLSQNPTSAAADILRVRWWGRADHDGQIEWLVSKTRDRDPASRALAWTTLIAAGDPLERTAVRTALKDLELAIVTPGEGNATLVYEIEKMPVPLVSAFVHDMGATPGFQPLSGRLASIHSLDPVSGIPLGPMDEAPIEELIGQLENAEGDRHAGARAFDRYGCAACHNLHGEGPATAPDLFAGGRQRNLAEWITAIVRPGEVTTPEYQLKSVDGRQDTSLAAWSEIRTDSGSEWVDTAGNVFLMGPTVSSPLIAPGSVCGPERPLSHVDLFDLVSFLQDMGP